MGFDPLGWLFGDQGEEKRGKAIDQYRAELDAFDSELSSSANPLSARTLGEVGSRFGVKPFDRQGYRRSVRDAFTPARQGLSTGAANARRGVASRLGSSAATPEFAFSGVDSSYLDALGNLGGDQARADLAGFDKETAQNNFAGSFLADVSQKNIDNRMRMKREKASGLNAYLNNVEDGSVFEDLAGVAGTVAAFL